MNKYYVESGPSLRYIVLAADELDAICRAVSLASASRSSASSSASASATSSATSSSTSSTASRAEGASPEATPLRMADLIIVSERGFVWDRPDHQLYGDEFVLPTRLVLGQPEPFFDWM